MHGRILDHFHPAVAGWFGARYGEPTEPQREGWPAIRSRRHTLIAAPTGSGKTLAAFLAAIDDLVCQADGPQGLAPVTQVLYISPLKALGNDIQRNLQEPLAGIRAQRAAEERPLPEIRVQVRSGDTPASERAAMVKRPPHILVTTPESLYILLTSVRGRELLRPVRTVIVDEIHALVGNKRGSHLALSLERLAALCDAPPVRVGLSATQRPIAEVARFLVGAGAVDAAGQPDCTIVDAGHVRRRDLAVEVPDSPLEAVMSGEVWTEVYGRLADLIEQHCTTLVFVNTRRLAERVARHLSERLGEGTVTAHHGSMSKEHRLDAEQRLKSGELRALVATASLELGIDVGAVELVCQVGATKSIAAFLQRVGRSGHSLSRVPKGRLFPLTRDELVDCAALLDAVRREELDALWMPQAPLDVLAQQMIAAVACEDWRTDDLYALARRAWPYRELTRDAFDDAVGMLSRGFATRRGRSGAYLHHDAVNGRLRARRGARPTAIMNGGAIPETALFDVVLEPQDQTIGSVDEDFAVESLPGDIFQLGNASWRILRIEPGRVRVEDAQGQPPNIPFWIGEGPGRTDELSQAVSRLRTTVAGLLDTAGGAASAGASTARATPTPLLAVDARQQGELALPDPEAAGVAPPRTAFVHDEHPAVRWLVAELGLPTAAALQLAEYLAGAKAALGVMPSQETLVVERFFDEGGGMQLVLHAPFGSRLNRGWGLALRKRFCRQFNFELQAAANEDAVVLSLGPTHSFPLDEVFRYLNSRTVRDVLVQALLDAPMFTVRWRHNANRALAVLRRLGGRKIAPQLQRMRAEDLLALVFPDQQACLENIQGDREVPEHPLVQQTLADCLTEAMDIDGLEALLRRMEAGELALVTCDLREPSPLAHEILNARPYAFLDDAPLEERRTQAVVARRWLDPDTAASLGALDPAAIAQVRGEAWPLVSTPDELHDALLQAGLLAEGEGRAGRAHTHDYPIEPDLHGPGDGWEPLLAPLAAQGRAALLTLPEAAAADGDGLPARWWAAAEWLPALRALYPTLQLAPEIDAPAALRAQDWTPEQAAQELVRARLESCGPVTAAALAATLHLPQPTVQAALLALEAEGYAFRGRYTPGAGGEEWCERGLLARIHRYTLNKLRREVEPVAPADYLRFLFGWQRVAPGTQVAGMDGLAAVIEQLEGVEAPAAAWEAELLAARSVSYDKAWLDALCTMGRVAWARLTPPANGPRRGGPVATTPIALLNRRHLPLWRRLRPADDEGHTAGDDSAKPARPLSAQARTVAEALAAQGASFFADLAEATGLLPTHLEAALGELVAAGRVTADSFAGLRALLRPAHKRPSPRRMGPAGAMSLGAEGAGRWSLLRATPPAPEADPAAERRERERAMETYAWVLLRRYGVVCRRLLEREPCAPPWRELVRVLRRLEARGEIRGGRFVANAGGEQYALPEAVGSLRETRRQAGTGALVSLSAADPLNLLGIIAAGRRLPALTGNRVLYRDGVPVAVLEAGETRFLVEVPDSERWVYANALLGRNVAPLPGAHPVPAGD